jgi:hypothetical protein
LSLRPILIFVEINGVETPEGHQRTWKNDDCFLASEPFASKFKYIPF